MVITLGFLPEPLALITDNHILRPATLAAGLSVALLASAAHEQPDTLLLESVEVVATGPIAPITRRDGSILFTDKALDHTVRTMGEADMLRLVSLAAGASSALLPHATKLATVIAATNNNAIFFFMLIPPISLLFFEHFFI